MSSITLPLPMAFVFLDENPNSINDGYWASQGPVPTYNGYWVDLPAVYHNFACNLSFADGHAEVRKWKDQTVIDGIDAGSGDVRAVPFPGVDAPWMQARETTLISTTAN
jgi:prepilin-type processing-associated H-X9-DG protein